MLVNPNKTNSDSLKAAVECQSAWLLSTESRRLVANPGGNQVSGAGILP